MHMNNLRKQVYEQENVIQEIQENQKFIEKELVRIETRINNLEKNWEKMFNITMQRIEAIDKQTCHGLRYEDVNPYEYEDY